MKTFLWLFSILLLSSIGLKAQSKVSDSTSFDGNYKRQDQAVNQNKIHQNGQSFEYVEDKAVKSDIEGSDYKHTEQKQTGGVLPVKPVEKKQNSFFSKRNYKHQF
jgi:hypothetical protein